MSDKLHNPFLSPPQAGQASSPLQAPLEQAQTPSQVPTGQPHMQGAPQGVPVPAAPAMPAQAGHVPVASHLSANPFLATSQAAQQAPHPQSYDASLAPTPVQTSAQTSAQAPLQPPAASVTMPAAAPAAPISAMPLQATQAPSAPAMAQHSVIRETAAQAAPAGKAPNPFDFANQGGASASPQSTGASKGDRLRYKPLKFTGGVGEYYGIVILNALLTLITFGIYAPWAKVRKKRFFFSHTELLDEGFHYLATGKQLFIGRIIAILALVALSVAELIPLIGVPLSVAAVLFGLPFVLNRSIGFNARNLAWRDVRFGWDGSFSMAFLVWMIYPLLSIFTLGLAQPLAARALRRHYADNHSFGAARFSADLSLAAFYFALLKALCFAVIVMAIFGGITGLLAYGAIQDLFVGIQSYDDLLLKMAFLTETEQILLALPFFAVGFALYLSGQFYFALVRHVMINHLRLSGGIRFQSQLSAFKYALVILTNLMLNIMTIGFAHPFTVIRHYRYLTEAIEVRPIADMAGFIDKQANAGFSVFEEVSDIEGLSIDI